MDGGDSGAAAVVAAEEGRKAVCVTGATGYIGSWLVGSLLRRGYRVHAAARDIGKASQILSSFGRKEQLRIFRADLNEEGSFDEAVKGCIGVFHVAASMEFNTSVKENIDDHVRSEILQPAIRGAINVLQACSRSGSVKRVVFTSSISTITAKDCNGDWKTIVDESSITPIHQVWREKLNGWVYVLSKLLTEEEAVRFAKENGIDLVSIIPPTVAGPFLTPTVPASVQVLLSPITGDPMLSPILASVYSRLGSISLVHIQDICDAHIFLMENKASKDRYLCSVGSYSMPQLADLLSSECPSFDSERFRKEFQDTIPSVISSKRLNDLGYKFRYNLKDIVKQSVSHCTEYGFLK